MVAKRHRGAAAVRTFVKLLSAILILTLLATARMCAQTPPHERVYQHPKSDVDRVLQQIHASLGGRLPVLDGFVDTIQDLDRYSRGYYQCSVQVTPAGSGATSVRVTAKITAWYGAPGAAAGDYRVLPSNGRIETDLLDRLEEALGGRASMSNSEPQRLPAGETESPNSSSETPTPSPAPTRSAGTPVPQNANQPNGSKSLLDRIEEALGGKASGSNQQPQPLPAGEMESPNSASETSTPNPNRAPSSSASAAPVPASANQPNVSKSAILRSLPPVGVSVVPAAPLVNPETPLADSEDLDSLRVRREKAERREQDLSTDVKNLEEIQRNQAHPTDLAIIKRSGTPVLAGPDANARVLFRAEAEDEFPVIDKQTTWVHVQISGDSRGWVRRTEVDWPDALAQSSSATAAESTEQEQAFRVAREETNSFPGKWEPLHGKTVKIIWVEPSSASATSPAEAKRSFAKSLLLKAYQEILEANQQVDGVVIVFDSADGGQISATLAALKQWRAGSLSEASFWKQCALDPPELLQDSAKGSGEHL
jgi:hypothetical protein